MAHSRQAAKINVKLLLIILSAVVLLGVGAFVARHVRRSILAERSRSAGMAAYDRKDWSEAAKHFAEYLGRRPKDCEILRRYGESLLSIRPLEQTDFYRAAWAYRELMNLQPQEDWVYEKLAGLYTYANNVGELAYVARKRLERDRYHPAASIWLARALVGQRKFDQAEETLLAFLDKGGTKTKDQRAAYVQACRLLSIVASQLGRREPLDLKDPIWAARGLITQRDHDLARLTLQGLAERFGQQKGRHFDYIEACTLLSLIATEAPAPGAAGDARKWADRAIAHDPASAEAHLLRLLRERNASDEAVAKALQAAVEQWTPARVWAERAVDHDSDSCEARLFRAGLLRKARPDDPAVRVAFLLASRADLLKAQTLPPADPGMRLILCEEWIEHREFQRAAAVLAELDNVEPESLQQHYVDLKDWDLARFLLAARLAARREAAAGGVALADRAISELTAQHHRAQVLPPAIRLYVAGGEIAKAARCLEEYLALRPVVQDQLGAMEVALLRALVAGAEGKPYPVIRILEPVAAEESCPASVWHMLGQAYVRTGQTLRAVQALHRYLARNPGDRAIRLLLAAEYLQQGHWESALEQARGAESQDPGNLDAKLARIEAAMHAAADRVGPPRAESLTKLSGELAALAQAHPKVAGIYSLRASLAILERDFPSARKHLAEGIKQCGPSPELASQFARLAGAAGQGDQAEAACRSACREHPQSALSWQSLAQTLLGRGKADEAREMLQRGLQTVRDLRDRRGLSLALAELEILRGDRAAGIGLLKDLAHKYPDEAHARSLLLSLPEVLSDAAAAQKLVDEIRQIQGDNSLLWRRHQCRLWLTDGSWRFRHREIAAQLKAWSESEPQWPFAALALAQLHQLLGHLEEAEAVCRRALALNPDSVETAGFLVALLEKQTRYGEAGKVLEDLEAGPQRISTLRVRLALGRRDLDGAIEELKLRLTGDRGDAAGHILLARLLYRRDGSAKEALEYLDQAEAISPDSMAIAATRVAILQAEGKADQALDVLDRYVRKTGSFAAYLLRARYHESRGADAKADEDYRHLTTFPRPSQGYELLARFYDAHGRLDDAAAAIENGLKACGDDASLQRALLTLLIRRKRAEDLDRAQKMLAGLERGAGQSPDLLWARAELARAGGGPDAPQKAREALERLVELAPDSVRGHLALIELAQAGRDLAAMDSLAARGLKANPQSVPLLLVQAEAGLALGHFEAAAETCLRVLVLDADNVEAPILMYRVALATQIPAALDEVQEAVRQALARCTEDPYLHLAHARVLYTLGRAQDAIGALETYAKSPPGSRGALVFIALAEMHREQGNLDEAGTWLGRAAGLAPASADVLRERLHLLEAQGKYDQVASLAAAHAADKDADFDVLIAAAGILASCGQEKHLSEARRLHARAEALAARQASRRLPLASLAVRMREYAQAERIYRDVLRDEPDSEHAMNGLAWVLATARHDYQAALPLADKAVKRAPRNSYVRDTRGVILSHLPGRLPDARKEFEACVELTIPHSALRAKALMQLGEVCARLEDHAAAREHLEEALSIDRKSNVFTDEQRRNIREVLKGLPAAPATQRST